MNQDTDTARPETAHASAPAGCLPANLTGVHWRTSSYSAGEGECVEVADLPGGAAVRDSKLPDQAHLHYPTRSWTAFQEVISGR